MTINDGVIKFKFTLKRSKLETQDVLPLEKWRALLFKLQLIGEYPTEKIGYGNLSLRSASKADAFIITGSQTGHLAHLKAEHYCQVVSCDIDKMTILAEGLIPPSSEASTHGAIYQHCPHINAVFHVHSPRLWNCLIKEKSPAIEDSIEYGTAAMALAAKSLIQQQTHGFFVMKGHQDGLVAYGSTAQEAGIIILQLYRQYIGQDDVQNPPVS